MQVLLVPLVLLVAAGILGLIIRKRCKSTKQKLLTTLSVTAVVAVAFGLCMLFIFFSAASKPKYSRMMEIDDERWFNADEVFSANFSEAKPLRAACPKPSSPDFDKFLRKKLCSVIIECNGGTSYSYLFAGWEIKKRPRQAGTNIVGAVIDIEERLGPLSGNGSYFAHGDCFNPVAYFHGSGPDPGHGESEQAADSRPPSLTSQQPSTEEVPLAPAPQVHSDPGGGDVGLGTESYRRQVGDIEILSDTHGVDLGPYLQHVSHEVRENWYVLTPESAQMKKGNLAIEFTISKDGQIAGIHLAVPSGDVGLDQAALGGITASNPFPPMPSDFGGPYLTLRFRFVYPPRKNLE